MAFPLFVTRALYHINATERAWCTFDVGAYHAASPLWLPVCHFNNQRKHIIALAYVAEPKTWHYDLVVESIWSQQRSPSWKNTVTLHSKHLCTHTYLGSSVPALQEVDGIQNGKRLTQDGRFSLFRSWSWCQIMWRWLACIIERTYFVAPVIRPRLVEMLIKPFHESRHHHNRKIT